MSAMNKTTDFPPPAGILDEEFPAKEWRRVSIFVPAELLQRLDRLKGDRRIRSRIVCAALTDYLDNQERKWVSI